MPVLLLSLLSLLSLQSLFLGLESASAVGVVSRDANFRVEEFSEVVPMVALARQCPHSSAIASIGTIMAGASDGIDAKSGDGKSKAERKYFTQLSAGMARVQNVCVQFDVDLFELTAAVATSGATEALPTAKVLPFKTIISFALNLQVLYGSCKRNENTCPLSISAEGSIGVGIGVKLSNLKGLSATAFISGSFEISTDAATMCDPSKHGKVAFISPVSFKCGAGWLLGTWFSNFFQHRLSTDPQFSAQVYRGLIIDRTSLDVELGAAEEEEVIQAMLSDVGIARSLYNDQDHDPLAVAKHPMYQKGSQLMYRHSLSLAPVFWAESQLAEVYLQRRFEYENADEYHVLERNYGSKVGNMKGTAAAHKHMYEMLAEEAPYQQHSRFSMRHREHVGLYPDPHLPTGYSDNAAGQASELTKLAYTGQSVFTYISSKSDRLRTVYSLPRKGTLRDHDPTVETFDFFKLRREGCDWNKGKENSDECFVKHPAFSASGLLKKRSRSQRVAFGGVGGIFKEAKSLLDLQRAFVWYARWLLEIRVLNSFFWPSKASEASKDVRYRLTRLDSCEDLPVSFEDVVHHSDKTSAGMQLAREWGMFSCNGNKCDNDYRYIWNPRYWCHIGKNVISDIPTSSEHCKNSRAHSCIHMQRPIFDQNLSPGSKGLGFQRVRDRLMRPMSRYLWTKKTESQRSDKFRPPNPDPYPATGFDELFPDEYAIPRWSANIFPYVTEAVMDTMVELRRCMSVREGVAIIQKFRTELQSVVPYGGLQGDIMQEWSEGVHQPQASSLEEQCPGEPLCVTATFEHFFKVVGVAKAVDIKDQTKLSFGERAAKIMPGLAYKVASGYANIVRGNLKAIGDKIAKTSAMLKLKARVSYSAGLAFGVSVGKSMIGFCTPDTNTFQANLPMLFWRGFFEPGSLGKKISFRNPDSWAAEFFVFFPGFPVNLHVKRVGRIGPGPDKPYKYEISVKVRVKNEHPVGSFSLGGSDQLSWSSPTEVAGISGVPHFVASVMPTLAENLIPALIQIVYYAGDILHNPDITAKDGMKLLQQALGSLLKPHGALLAMGAGWFLPESGANPFTSAMVNALIISATIEPEKAPTITAKYAYLSIKELTLNVVPALDIKPAMTFGFRWDLGKWLNANVLVNNAPKSILKPGDKGQDPFPDSAFRTDRCNACIGVFEKVIFKSARSKYCPGGEKDELCLQVETAVKTFLSSNGSPGLWRHVIGGINRATKLSFEKMFDPKKGIQKAERKRFEESCKEWPSERGRSECLAQEFCLYSGIACHAKLRTSEEKLVEAESLISSDTGASMMPNTFGGKTDGRGKIDLADVWKLNRNREDDEDKPWLDWPASRAIKLRPSQWSQWLRHNHGYLKRNRNAPVAGTTLKGSLAR